MISEVTPADREVVRQPAADVLVVGDEALVLYETCSIRLTPIGWAVYQLTAEPTMITILAQRLVDQFGSPPDGGDLLAATQGVVDQLEQLQVLAYLGVSAPEA